MFVDVWIWQILLQKSLMASTNGDSVAVAERFAVEAGAMMGRINHDQGQLFYSFCLEDAVPAAG
jgi:hypothetical protein